jgi:hypothetical protein
VRFLQCPHLHTHVWTAKIVEFGVSAATETEAIGHNMLGTAPGGIEFHQGRLLAEDGLEISRGKNFHGGVALIEGLGAQGAGQQD